ncbi:universal stress protein [Streptomyces fodineus]|uniref:Universal stress protein n=1 Tax=Streptomyces fodineus TaxID=1904616 RepID=A0A1D7Y375_9ACTN|nr:universal stress protein [Streptomyces fodineus]AOR30034.1 universal stress protein [Streptomyces fodineus]
MTTVGRSGTVLVGMDDTSDAWLAVEWAAAEAELSGDALRILHSVDLGEEPEGADQEDDARVVQTGAGVLDDAQARIALARPGLGTDVVLARGHPAEALVAAARDADARLIVVGTRGRGGFTGLLVGSVSLKLAAHADRPVAVVRGRSDGDAVRDVVVVGIADERDGDVVRFGLAEAGRRGTTVRLLHAWTPLSRAGLMVPQVSRVDDDMRLHEQLLDRALAPVAEYPRVHAEPEMVIGSAAGVLVEASERAGLVVVGRRPPRGRLGLRLGTVSHAVLHHANCPVAVVPVAAGQPED